MIEDGGTSQTKGLAAKQVQPNVFDHKNIGVHYDTSWARSSLVSALRDLFFSGFIGPLARFICSPTVQGLSNLNEHEAPVIFAPNHVSHFDTIAVLCTLPRTIRRRTAVAAAVDNFYDKRWKCILYSFILNTIPVERTKINRKSADVAAGLLEEGYNLLIFPEGGRSLDDHMMEFRGGAAYLAKRCDVPVIPIFLDGPNMIMPKGRPGIHRHPINVTYGSPLRIAHLSQPDEKEENPRRFTKRIQAGVVALGGLPPKDWE
jgi:1-acyl-sn-glycerol-3-phosphate acyltransferase